MGDEREGETRVPTVSFVVGGERAMRSRDVVAVFDREENVRFWFLLSANTKLKPITISKIKEH